MMPFKRSTFLIHTSLQRGDCRRPSELNLMHQYPLLLLSYPCLSERICGCFLLGSADAPQLETLFIESFQLHVKMVGRKLTGGAIQPFSHLLIGLGGPRDYHNGSG